MEKIKTNVAKPLYRRLGTMVAGAITSFLGVTHPETHEAILLAVTAILAVVYDLFSSYDGRNN